MTTTPGKSLAGLVLAALCATATVPTPGWASAPVLVIGPATVIDGNHLRVRDTTVQLSGIEAPADDWCREPPREGCAAKAAKALRHIIGEYRTPWFNDRVRHDLVRAEQLAKADKAGMWSGRVSMPRYVKQMRGED